MRYAMGFEYDGSRFFGWQVQRENPTVQGCVEQALSRVADQRIQVHCSGRTDTGVHGLNQVVHFDTAVQRSDHGWLLGCNSNLPTGITALWIRPVPDDFHARFSAHSRTYRYLLLNRATRPAVLAAQVSWYRKALDADLMQRAAQYLVGEHDFSTFRAAGCQANHAVREINAISCRRNADYLYIDITANGFLYHMVRNIVGSLLVIGTGEQEPEWMQDILQQQDRKQAGVTAPANGLYFVGPRYASTPPLPEGSAGMLLPA